MSTERVIVAGAGPAGLAVAIELGRRGVDCVVVEAASKGGYKLPRTNLVNTRSMEHFRRWGIADQLRSVNPISASCARDVVFCTALTGFELHTFERPFVGTVADERASERAEWIPQRAVEATLVKYAESLPSVQFRWGWRVKSFSQSEHQVEVEVVSSDDPNLTDTLQGSYLAGCDGSRSPVRHGMGIRLEGTPNLLEALVYDLKVPTLEDELSVGFATGYWVINGAFDGNYSGLFCPQGDGRMQFVLMPKPAGCDPDSHEDVAEILFAAVGKRIPVEFIRGRGWNLHSIIAPVFQDRRVFIAGDAAHLIPNLGGFGMNISLLDGIDLGWKLAATICGWGGENLLASYTPERRGADLWVKQIQDYNASILSPDMYRPGMEDDTPEAAKLRAEVKDLIIETKTQEFSSLGCQLGYRYESSPIIVPDGTTSPPQDPIEYCQTAYPGSLAPHRWLAETESLFDRFGPEFTLLRTNPAADTTALERAAHDRRLPLTTLTVPELDLRGLYAADLVMIRPDQHVAWRGDQVADPYTVIDHIRGAATGMPA